MTEKAGGRPRAHESIRFEYYEKTPKEKYYFIKCKRCLRAHSRDLSLAPPRVYKSRAITMRNHKCPARYASLLYSPVEDEAMLVEPSPPRASSEDTQVILTSPVQEEGIPALVFQTPVARHNKRHRIASPAATSARSLHMQTPHQPSPQASTSQSRAFRTPVRSSTNAISVQAPVRHAAVRESVGVPSRESRVERALAREEFTQPTRMALFPRAPAFDESENDPSEWGTEQMRQFERHLAFFQHAHRLPDSWLEKDESADFLNFLRPGVASRFPPRRTMGGRIVRDIAAECIAEDTKTMRAQQAKYDGRLNFLSDVWQNVSRVHLLACQLTLFGLISTFAVAAVGTRHDGLAIAADLEQQLQTMIAAGWIIGAIVTDNAGQCARARRILAKRWTNIVFLHCFAHAINNLVRSVLNVAFKATAASAASTVHVLNNSSSKWLQRANKAMIARYGKSLSFLTMCDTRWNSMQACFASLLRVKTALVDFNETWSTDPEYPVCLKVLEIQLFGLRSKLRRRLLDLFPTRHTSFNAMTIPSLTSFSALERSIEVLRAAVPTESSSSAALRGAGWNASSPCTYLATACIHRTSISRGTCQLQPSPLPTTSPSSPFTTTADCYERTQAPSCKTSSRGVKVGYPRFPWQATVALVTTGLL